MTLLKATPDLAVAVFLIAMWRGGYRGEVTRITAVSVIMLTTGSFMGVTGAAAGFVLCCTCAVICALFIVRRRPSARRPRADGDQYQEDEYDDDGYARDNGQDEPPPAGVPAARYDSGALADHVRRQRQEASLCPTSSPPTGPSPRPAAWPTGSSRPGSPP